VDCPQWTSIEEPNPHWIEDSTDIVCILVSSFSFTVSEHREVYAMYQTLERIYLG
jgi:hypothetical protein